MIDERLKGWSFPKVTVQLNPGAVRCCPKRPYVCRKREMQAMELMVNNLERDGIVTRLSRAAVDHRQVWISPAFAVPKATVDEVAEPLTAENVDRAYRLVVDERCINESVKDLLPSWGTYMRSIDECLAELPASDVWYAGLDVGQAFFNLEYDESCSHLFGFAYYDFAGTVQYALFRFMTMGFKLSSFFWAYAIHSLLATAIPEAYCTDSPTHILTFVDDILAWSRFIDECVHLKSLLVYILEKVNAKAPIAKRKGPAREIDYVGLTLVQAGYRISDATLEILRTNLKTKHLTLRGLRTKLGLLQFCRSLSRPERNRAEKTLSQLTAPFTSLVGSMVAAKSKKTARLPWTADLEASWKAIGDNMGNAFVPFHSQMDNWDGMQLVLMSDASPEAGAACLWRLPREKFATNPKRTSADWLSDNAQLIGVWTHKLSTYEKAHDIADLVVRYMPRAGSLASAYPILPQLP
ncbi:hypothetical protein FOZ61_009326 [Perkinsus olseni]|uniref:Reverse transcriptase domain-containing protein n=1 Tax=Perkinsus olseni TaxID=32597 RepID=A0A7J6L168_PEROL|nr:hypothetical protein FOZ61_009326 [Perkinsus olseni]KAF4655187.1 hypothetical protein FOL46_008336 [Perkinsus olseni]